MAIWLLALLAAGWARADTVYLRNGNQLTGVISGETRTKVTLDFGYGTTDIDRSEVLRIDRSRRASAMKEVERRKFDVGQNVPREDRKLDALFRVVQSKRRQALEAEARDKELAGQESSLEQTLPDERQRYQEAERALAVGGPSPGPIAYNELVRGANEAGSTLNADEVALSGIEPQRRASERAVNDYISAYRSFAAYLGGDGAAFLARRDDYTDWLRGRLKVMAADFRREEIPAEKRAAGVFVNVRLNNGVTGRFLVDTGASETLLYKEIAQRLQLKPTDVLGRNKTKVADGRTVDALDVHLASIAVGRSEVRDASAVVVPVGDQGFDGLLGMSFLRHFVCRVDLPNGRLILESLK